MEYNKLNNVTPTTIQKKLHEGLTKDKDATEIVRHAIDDDLNHSDIAIAECELEEVYVDGNDEVLTEAAIRQWKKSGQKMVKKYRCLAGPKEGRLVSKPGDCATRKDPKKVRHGRKVMRSKKGVIKRKTKIAKRKSISIIKLI